MLRNLGFALLLLIMIFGSADASARLSDVELFDAVWGAVAESYAGPDFDPSEWDAIWYELRPQAERAKDAAAVEVVIARMLARLHDPHTYYLNPQQKTAPERINLAQDRLEVDGIGALLAEGPGGSVVVREVLPQSPAAEAGIRPGTRISAVDGRTVKGMASDAVAELVRGTRDTRVTLTLIDPWDKSKDITLSRALVQYRTDVYSEMLADKIGYLHVPGGGEGFELQVLKQLRKLHRARALILDLRSGWDTIDLTHMLPILKIAGLFTDKSLGTLVSRQGDFDLIPQIKWENPSPDMWWKSLFIPPPTAWDVYKRPMAVLVDDSTTWDIIALGLQEIGRAIVVGRPTSEGGGALAGGYELVGGAGLSVTITYYSSPQGHSLKAGMKPDVTVPMDMAYLAARYQGEDPDIKAATKALGR